jgi:hypothetical protein
MNVLACCKPIYFEAIMQSNSLSFLRLAILAVFLFPLWLAAQGTQILEGPLMDSSVSGHSNYGIAFDSLDYVRLLGFDVHTQGSTDQVQLLQDGILLYSLDVPAAPIFSVAVDWALTPGTNYWLIGTNGNNGRYAYAFFPEGNSHISVTSGIFSSSPYGNAWGGFRNIVTTTGDVSQNPIPEPSTVLLTSLVLVALLGSSVFRSSRRRA